MNSFLPWNLTRKVVPVVHRITAPSSADTQYRVPTLWLDDTTDNMFLLADVTAGVATWKQISTDPLRMNTVTDPATNAATTTAIVDGYAGVIVTTTAAGNSQTLSSPTNLTAGKVFTFVNNDTSTHSIPVVANGVTFTVTPGETQAFIWDGNAWGPTDIGITSIPVIPSQGGTGISSYVIGDMLYASGTTTLSKLAGVAVGSVLISGGVGAAPSWSGSPTLTTSLTVPTIIAPAASLVLKPTTDATTAIKLADKDGNAVLTVDTVNNRIGIGTTAPGQLLSLYSTGNNIDTGGVLRIVGNIAGDTVELAVKDTFTRLQHIENADDAAYGYGILKFKTNAVSTPASPKVGGFLWSTGSADVMAITNTGNVTIGSGTGTAGKLDVRDGQIALTNTNVAHGMTTIAETTQYAGFTVDDANAGGLFIKALSDADSMALKIRAIIGSDNPTDTTAAIAFTGGKKNGMGWQALAAAETVLKVQNYTTDLITVLGSGATYFSNNVVIGGSSSHYGLQLRGYNYAVDGVYHNFYYNSDTSTTHIVKQGTGGDVEILAFGNTGNVNVLTGSLVVGSSSPNGKLDIWNGNFTLSDSDVAHGMTDIAATTVYSHFSITDATAGGLSIRGLSDADVPGIVFYGINGSASPTEAGTILISAKKNGTTSGALAVTEKAYVFRNYATDLITVLGSGNTYLKDGASLNFYATGHYIKVGTGMEYYSADYHRFFYGTTEVFRTNGSGQVLIGAVAAIGSEILRVDGDAYFDHDVSSSTMTSRTDFTLTGSTGGFVRKYAETTANISAAATVTIEVNVPATAKILACQLRVDAALAAGELWDAAYSGGSTDAICSGQAVAQNTKVNSFTSAVVTSETDIAITKNGGGSFTAQGTIRAIVYYELFDAMADA